MEESAQKLAARLVGRRVSLGYSQAEVARRSGLSLRSVQNYEGGAAQPTGKSLRKLCAVLGVSMGFLAGTEDAKVAEAAPMKEGTGYGSAPVPPDWATALISELQAMPPSRRQRVLGAIHSIIDAFGQSDGPSGGVNSARGSAGETGDPSGLAHLAQQIEGTEIASFLASPTTAQTPGPATGRERPKT